ncbi:hypothetical protein GH714_035481 [Hevea brasiliensis]|uniref:MACPF domain-containing protein n=1 Tax=Hevea brasiliensis TaxID=3981 RepID=A0A6A6NKH8_HEVBR|nr:hypothetical protein GH714_035481 [Hevea brasiliensis]
MEAADHKSMEVRAMEALGKGFDLTSDFRLKFTKERLVELDHQNKRDVIVPGGLTIPDVSQDISFDKGDRIRFKSDVLEFNQMSELLNQKCSIHGKVPSGYLNSIFDLTGEWFRDASDTKYLAFDGYFIALYYLHLTASPLILQDKVRKSVPPRWNPASLASDVFLQVPEVFSHIRQSNTVPLTSIAETSNKDGLTIICSKRGGDVFSRHHSNWLQTVPIKPEAILFKFVPITSLLTGIPGSGYLSHAINLYLRYKPAPEDLEYFLEFQVPKQWAPMFFQDAAINNDEFFDLVTIQVSSDQKPVVGLRLYLEGKKCNLLALHLQHLSSLPNIMTFPSRDTTICRPCQWRGSDDYKSGDQFLEPIRWKRYSRVCTSVVKHDPNWLQGDSTGVFIVTGAQLLCKGKWPKTRTISGPEKQPPAALNSGVYPDGPPVPIRSGKLLKYVETAEVVRGPHDAPGHWLVTAAKLVTEGGKIGLHVKFALLDYQ